MSGAPPSETRSGEAHATPIVIAIDGPAASGKGTIARSLAQAFALPHLDTGMLYRAVGAKLLFAGADLSDEPIAIAAARGLTPEDLGDGALRTAPVGKAASVVAALPGVRAALLEYQRAFAADPRGAVLDGRDIGSVICPKAPVKLFVTATPEERARRRAAELSRRGEQTRYETVLADIRARDARDMGRAEAPLIQVSDAHLLDTTDLAIDAAVAKATAIVRRSTSTI